MSAIPLDAPELPIAEPQGGSGGSGCGTPAHGRKVWRFRLAIPFLLTLPHFAVPLLQWYPAPLASALVALEVALLAVVGTRLATRTGVRWFGLSSRAALFWLYCVLSAIYGFLSLHMSGQGVLPLTGGPITYVSVAAARVIQLSLALLAFEFIRRTSHRRRSLLAAWLAGLVLAVGMHGLSLLVSSDPLLARAGTFTEGNQAGLYYLISMFVALEYWRVAPGRVAFGLIALSVLGLLLSRSSAGLIVLALSLCARSVLGAKGLKQRFARFTMVACILAAVVTAMLNTSLGTDLTEKLFEEEVTPNSFSRIDRIISAQIGVDLFLRSPVVGHGLQSYGFLSNDYIDGPLADVYDWSYRRIPNNIYVEVASELGLVGLTLFFLILVGMWRTLKKNGMDPVWNFRSGLLAILVYWLAFPTYSIVFVWAFLGLATHSATALPARRVASKVTS